MVDDRDASSKNGKVAKEINPAVKAREDAYVYSQAF
jgi:hypothetical protein